MPPGLSNAAWQTSGAAISAGAPGGGCRSPHARRHRNQARANPVSTKSVSRVVALEEAFLHPRVWDLFSESLQRKYQPVRARLSDVGAERVRLMDAAGIDVQVLSHVQPGIQVLA